MTKPYTINQIKSIVSPIAKEHGVASVALFGSYATGRANAESDIDLKIEKGMVRSLTRSAVFGSHWKTPCICLSI